MDAGSNAGADLRAKTQRAQKSHQGQVEAPSATGHLPATGNASADTAPLQTPKINKTKYCRTIE